MILSKYCSNQHSKCGLLVNTSYISLINPFLLKNYSYENYKRVNKNKPNEKIYVKQSYVILTWFYYLNFLTTKKNKFFVKNIKLFIAPKKIKKFTITKAPIAHKTRSKEQILTNFFCYKTSYKIEDPNNMKKNLFFETLDQVLLLILLAKDSLSLAETNLFFVKRNRVLFKFSDSLFFTYKK
jgi:hypothetical protein